MKVKVISRSTDEFTGERSRDLQRVFRNYDPSLHPQEKSVEYVRALNAAKLDKIFAKPFIGAMDGHIDAISCKAKNPNHLRGMFSGSMDGVILSSSDKNNLSFAVAVFLYIRLWDISSRQTVCQFPGHNGAVRGLTVSTDGRILVSCGNDCTVRLWRVPLPNSMESYNKPDNTIEGVDHRWDGSLFTTVGAQVDIWDQNRSEPISSFSWGSDTVVSVRFSPAHQNLLATSSSDRSITLYDLRTSTPLKKIIMQTRTNAISWNPREPMNFTAVRIFPYTGGHSKEIYHTKRMQRVFCVKFSCDASHVLSGSDDTNIRLWKAKASEQLGVLLPRERRKQEYQDVVVERYKHLPEVKRIVRHRHLPKPACKPAYLGRSITDAEKKREDRRKAHSAPGTVVTVPLRKRKILASVE